MLPTADIKRALRGAGFEVYRTRGQEVHLAERVRENLIMDAGIRVRGDDPCVYFYARAERSTFPGVNDDELFERARNCGSAALARGYEVGRTFVTHVTDPGDADHTLDSWYQVQFEKQVTSIEVALEEVRFAFGLSKTAKR